MKKPFLFLFFWCIAFYSSGQSSNPCSLSSVAISCNSPLNGDTRSSGNNIQIDRYSDCHTSQSSFNGGDEVYRIANTLSANTPVTVRLTASGRDLDLFIFDCIEGTSRCIAKSTGSSGNEQISIANWNARYRIVVDGYRSQENGPYSLTVSCEGGGDNSSNPCSLSSIPISCNNQISGDTRNASNNIQVDQYTCINTQSIFNGGDYVYRLSDEIPSNTPVTITFNSGTRDMDLFLFDCVSGTASCIANSSSPTGSEQITVNSWSSRYRIVVDGYRSQENGVFNLTVNCDLETPSPCTVSALPIGYGQVLNGDTRTSGNNFGIDAYSNCHSSQSAFNGGDAVYRITGEIPSGTDVKIRLTTSSRDLDLFVFDCIENTARCIAKSTGSSGNEEITISNWSSRYRIVVDGYRSQENSPYTIRILDPCSDFVDPQDVCNLITANYLGAGNNALAYRFNVPNSTPSGSWTAQRVGSSTIINLGSGRTRNYTFNTSGQYDICYTYTNNQGCEETCCKKIFINNPYSCTSINEVKNGNNYQLSLGNVNNNNIERWIDESNGNTIATQTNQISVPFPPSNQCKWYSVWYYDVTTDCYRVCCIEVCGTMCGDNAIDNDCPLITSRYIGGGNSLTYQFSVPNNTPSGSWTAQRVGGSPFNIGSGRTRNYTFNAVGQYIICYKYTDNNGCEKTCCRRIFIDNPYNCNRVTKTKIGTVYRLDLGNTANSSHVERWVDDSNGNTIATQTTQIDVPVPQGNDCKWYSVWYYDVTTECYRVCCIQVCGDCGEIDNNCPLISSRYTGGGNNLTYQFSVPNNTPSGSWTAQRVGGSAFNLGSGRSRTYTFSTTGQYIICYKYTDNNGCEQTCCRRIFIDNPYNCNRVTKTKLGTVYRLDLGNTANSNHVERWVDDSNGNTIATRTTQIDVPVPPPGQCKWYSVWYYDVTTECYRVCCIQVCGTICGNNAIDNNCGLITSRYIGGGNSLTYNFSVPNNTPSGSWTAQRAGGNPFNLGSGRSRSFTFSTVGQYIICYKYTDSDGCEKTCCRRIYIDNPYNCNQVTKTKIGNVYRLSLGNTANNSNVERWVDDSNGSTVATQTTTFDVPIPQDDDCKWYSVWYYDVTTDCYRVCCIQVCGCNEVDNNCNLITANYVGGGNGLTYRFSVPNNTPLGSWTAQQVGGSTFNLGSGRTRNHTFTAVGQYIICYKYTDSDGCEKTCCRRIFIDNPYNCNLVTKTKIGNVYRLDLGNTANSNNVERWVDDSNGSTIGTQTTTFDVPVPLPGQCKWYSVWYYDVTTGCYRVCCIQVCGPPTNNNCCPNGDATLEHLIDVFEEDCDDCGAEIICCIYNGQPAYLVYTGYDCDDNCDKTNFMVFDCSGQIQAATSNYDDIDNDIEIEDTLWECDDVPTTTPDCCATGFDPTTLPWVQNYINTWCQNTCSGQILYCSTLNGQPVLHLTPWTDCSDGQGQIFDCQGTLIETYGGFADIPRPAGLLDVRWVWDDSRCPQLLDNPTDKVIPTAASNDLLALQQDIRIANLPNPFSTHTDIAFELKEAVFATISIFDSYGQKVLEQEGNWSKGKNVFRFETAEQHTSGLYFVKIEGEGFSANHKILLVK